MVQTRNNKRAASESSLDTAHSKKVRRIEKIDLSDPSIGKDYRLGTQAQYVTRTEAEKKARRSPMKSSFKTMAAAGKKDNPVQFSRSLNYDDGTQATLPSPPRSSRKWYSDIDLTNFTVEQPSIDEQSTSMSEVAMTGDAMYNGLPTPPNTPSTPLIENPDITTAIGDGQQAAIEEDIPHLPKLGDLGTTEEHLGNRKVSEELLRRLVHVPRALTVGEASDALMVVRRHIKAFSNAHFAHELTAKEKVLWDLAGLQDKHPEFVANCAYIADGSQYGWRKLFTESQSRPQLVSALLGHYIVEHVFKHTCFGLTSAELASLEDDVLKRYIHYDGFVRVKELAKAIKQTIDGNTAQDSLTHFEESVEHLSNRIYETISPLLRCPNEIDTDVIFGIQGLVKTAGALARSIRLTGINRTVFRFNFPNKGSSFQLGGRQSCVNTAFVNKTMHHAPNVERDDILVKMPCWPTIVATVPTGPDMLDIRADPSLLETIQPIPEARGAPPDNPGSYVTEYIMTPSDVYLEWTPLAAPLCPSLKLTLWAAIAQAKQERALARGGQPWRRLRTPYVLGGTAVAGLMLAGTIVALRNPDLVRRSLDSCADAIRGSTLRAVDGCTQLKDYLSGTGGAQARARAEELAREAAKAAQDAVAAVREEAEELVEAAARGLADKSEWLTYFPTGFAGRLSRVPRGVNASKLAGRVFKSTSAKSTSTATSKAHFKTAAVSSTVSSAANAATSAVAKLHVEPVTTAAGIKTGFQVVKDEGARTWAKQGWEYCTAFLPVAPFDGLRNRFGHNGA